ncbi:hypothetical protein Y695_04113 [Hydrogenophaga sp. T4]|nr:hypothetical protein Y695_04113 [Hydrogenophaga sp. T4]
MDSLCSMSWRSLVVPAVTSTRRPLRSASSVTPESLWVSRRELVWKMDTENATWRARSRLWVVEPHSRSTEPFCTRGIRFCEVTGTSLTASAGSLSSRLMLSVTASIRSCE